MSKRDPLTKPLTKIQATVLDIMLRHGDAKGYTSWKNVRAVEPETLSGFKASSTLHTTANGLRKSGRFQYEKNKALGLPQSEPTEAGETTTTNGLAPHADEEKKFAKAVQKAVLAQVTEIIGQLCFCPRCGNDLRMLQRAAMFTQKHI